MNTKQYIESRFQKILMENLNEKADAILDRLNYDEEAPFNPAGEEFDYVQEGSSQVCNECGGMMMENECMECGYQSEGEIMELGGMEDGHPRFGKMKFKSPMSIKDIERLLRGDDDSDYDEDEDEEEIDIRDLDDDDDYDEEELDVETDWKELEEGEMCECGSPMIEGECTECGGMNESKKLTNKQKYIAKQAKPYNKIGANDFKKLRSMKEEDETLYEVEFEKEIDEYSFGDDKLETVKPYGDFSTDSPNKFGKVKNVGDKYQRKISKKFDDYELDEEVEEGNAFTGALSKAKKQGKDSFNVDGKKYKVTESIIFTENEILSIIEEMVNEEKKFRMGEPKGYREYERAHKADKKENDDYLKMVAKKMTDYLKGASDKGSKYEMKETKKFPTENGGLEKGNRKKYTPSDAVDEYIDAFSYPGQTNLVFDEIKPNDDRIEKYLKGHSTTGNAQVDKDGNPLGNVVPSEVGEKFFKNYQENLYGQEQQNASYKRQTQPVDQAGEKTESGSLKSKKGKKTAQGVLNKIEETYTNEKEVIKLTEEFVRMQNLMNYTKKTQ